MALHGMVGALIGHSFVSGLRDHYSHCDRKCTPAKIARNLFVSDSVDELHLIGASGACILPQEFDLEFLRGIRPTFAILEFGTCDLANGTDALSVADAVLNDFITTISWHSRSCLMRSGVIHCDGVLNKTWSLKYLV